MRIATYLFGEGVDCPVGGCAVCRLSFAGRRILGRVCKARTAAGLRKMARPAESTRLDAFHLAAGALLERVPRHRRYRAAAPETAAARQPTEHTREPGRQAGQVIE